MYRRNNSWCSDFIYKGQRYKKSLGPVCKTVAKERDRTFRSEVSEGRYQRKGDNPLFEKAARDFLDLHARNKKSYKSHFESRMKQLVKYFGKKRILEIDSNLVERYKNHRKNQVIERRLRNGGNPEDISFATINRELNILKKTFNWLKKSYKGFINPVVGVDMLEERERDRILSYEEEPKFFEAIEGNPKAEHLKPICLTALNTGMRKSEVLNLKKTDVNFHFDFIKVRDTKNGEDRIVPMNSVLKEVLKEAISKSNGSEYVFAKEDGRPYKRLNRAIKTACCRAGIEPLTFHSFRHTFGTRLGENGVSPKVIGEVGGWKSTKMVMRYTHPTPEYKRRAVESLCQVPPKSTPGHIDKEGKKQVNC